MSLPSENEERCPLCGSLNYCRLAAGDAYKGACWCSEANVPIHVLRFVAENLETACLCQRCLHGLSYYAQYSHEAPEILANLYQDIKNDPFADDSYCDRQGRTVFTTAYHLKRGYCCENYCKYCPYTRSVD
jgi:hypothetical protein